MLLQFGKGEEHVQSEAHRSGDHCSAQAGGDLAWLAWAVGPGFDPEMFRIRPNRVVSGGINEEDFTQVKGRSVR